MENNNLIFFNVVDYYCQNKIEINEYLNGLLNIKIGNEQSYKINIEPNLKNIIYRENQLDFISIVQLDKKDKIFTAKITAEPSRSIIVKEIIKNLKKEILKKYKIGLEPNENGYDEYSKVFNKYYWSDDIIGSDEIFDWNGGRPKLKPIIK
jgi:hypothetical protein